MKVEVCDRDGVTLFGKGDNFIDPSSKIDECQEVGFPSPGFVGMTFSFATWFSNAKDLRGFILSFSLRDDEGSEVEAPFLEFHSFHGELDRIEALAGTERLVHAGKACHQYY